MLKFQQCPHRLAIIQPIVECQRRLWKTVIYSISTKYSISVDYSRWIKGLKWPVIWEGASYEWIFLWNCFSFHLCKKRMIKNSIYVFLFSLLWFNLIHLIYMPLATAISATLWNAEGHHPIIQISVECKLSTKYYYWLLLQNSYLSCIGCLLLCTCAKQIVRENTILY